MIASFVSHLPDPNNNDGVRRSKAGFLPGDHVAVFPTNDPRLVEEIMQHLLEKPEGPVRISGPLVTLNPAMPEVGPVAFSQSFGRDISFSSHE